MATLYSPQAGSLSTTLVNDITDNQTIIEVTDITALPDAPNILTMIDGDNFETILYESIDEVNNELKDITRGVEGTVQSWTAGQEIARNFTAKDLLDAQNEIEKLLILTQELWLQEDESNINEVTTYNAVETDDNSINEVTTYNAVETDESTINSVTTNVS